MVPAKPTTQTKYQRARELSRCTQTAAAAMAVATSRRDQLCWLRVRQEQVAFHPDAVGGAATGRPLLESGATQGVLVLAPVPKPKDPTCDPALPLATDSPVIAAWRSRIATDKGQTTKSVF